MACHITKLNKFFMSRSAVTTGRMTPASSTVARTGLRRAVLPQAYQGGEERLFMLSQGAPCSGGAQDFPDFDRARRVQDELAPLLLQVHQAGVGQPPPLFSKLV